MENSMIAIVNVHPESAYSKHNGRSFYVTEIFNSAVCLIVNNVQVDFSFKEITIPHVDQEIATAKGLGDKYTLKRLEYYKVLNGNIVTQKNYNILG